MLTLDRWICVTLCCGGAALLTACAKSDRSTAGDTAAMSTSAPTASAPAANAPAPAATTPISLNDVAGKWNMTSTPDTGANTSPTTYVLTATASNSGWTLNFPGRPPVAVKVSTDADSITMDAGPYLSVRRKGMQVTTHSVTRMQGTDLVGMTVAHYVTKGADSVLMLKTHGTRSK